MRLNIDCLRDILLCIEEVADCRRPAVFVDTDSVARIGDHLGDHPKPPSYQEKFLHAYNSNEIMYHLKYCFHAGLIETDRPPSGMQFIVRDLTPTGHDFLSDIRSKTVFEKTKEIAAELQAQSIPSIQKIASSVISAIIKSHLNL